MITKNVKLYLEDGFPVRIPVSQFDTMWQFVFTIVNNSQPWQIPTGATAVLNGRKPDGNVFAFSGTIANNAVTVDADVQMTAVAGQTVCELSILADSKTIGTANFILDVEEAPKSADDVVSDTVLDGYGMMVTNAVDDWMNSHSGQIGGLTNEAKQALLTLLAHVAYTDDQGQTYLDALETALYPPVDLLSISAVFNQGDVVIYDTDELDVLKQYLTVTANYSDGTTETVTTYTLSGTPTVGTSTITVSFGGKTTTFDVVVAANTLICSWDFKNSLVDSVEGEEFTISGASSAVTIARGDAGLSFSKTAWGGITGGAATGSIFGLGTEIEIKFGAMSTNFPQNTGAKGSRYQLPNGGVLSAPFPIIWRGGSDKFSGWFNGAWQDSLYTSVEPTYFSGKTVLISVNADGSVAVSCDGNSFATAPAGTVSDNYKIRFGGSSDGQGYCDMVIESVIVRRIA